MDIIQQIFFEPFQLAFMQRALVAIVLIAVVSGVMGAYVIRGGWAWGGAGRAPRGRRGVGGAWGGGGGGRGAVLLGGMVAAVLSALGIGFLTRGGRLREDTAIGVIFAGTMALGIGIISTMRNYTTDLSHILIGNILSVSADNLLLIIGIGAVVLLALLAFYKEFLIISFDPVLAQTLRLPGEGLRLLLLVLLALTIVVSVQAVGVVLVAALLVTPAATARLLTMRLHTMMAVSVAIAVFSGISGLYLAWHLNIAASAAIVLTMTLLFLLAYFLAPGRGYLWSLLGRSARTA